MRSRFNSDLLFTQRLSRNEQLNYVLYYAQNNGIKYYNLSHLGIAELNEALTMDIIEMIEAEIEGYPIGYYDLNYDESYVRLVLEELRLNHNPASILKHMRNAYNRNGVLFFLRDSDGIFENSRLTPEYEGELCIVRSKPIRLGEICGVHFTTHYDQQDYLDALP